MFFRFQAVNDLVTELEQANITCAATITFAENDYKEQLQTLKVKNTLELVQFFPTALFIYFFFFIYVFVSRDSRLPFEIRLSTLLHPFLAKQIRISSIRISISTVLVDTRKIRQKEN